MSNSVHDPYTAYDPNELLAAYNVQARKFELEQRSTKDARSHHFNALFQTLEASSRSQDQGPGYNDSPVHAGYDPPFTT